MTRNSTRHYTRRQWAALAGAMAAGGAASVALTRSAPLGADLGDHPIAQQVLRDRISPQITPDGADVSIAVFTDYRCPACRGSDEALLDVAKSDSRVRIIFKEWPIFGEPSRLAAIAALSAARQDAYLAVRTALFDRRQLDASVLRKVVIQAGGQWDPIAAELARPGHLITRQLQLAQDEAFALGLDGTPAYVVGSRLTKGALRADELLRLITRVRRE